MNLRSIAPVLLLCLLLAGCGAAEREEETGVLESAAGLTENQENFLTVDGEAVPAWRYLYWLAMDCRRLEEQYAAADEPLDWDAALSEGETPAGVAKAAALEDMVLCAVTERWGTQFGCALTPEERAALTPWDSPWLTEAQGTVLAETAALYGKLYELCKTPGSPLYPAAGELEAFEAAGDFLEAERLLVPFSGDRDADRSHAAELFSEINSAADPAAAIETLMTDCGGTMTEADWTPSLRDAALALEPGQVSGILEGAAGYLILRRLTTDEETLRSAHFDSLLRAAAADCVVQVSDAYEALQPGKFMAALGRNGGEAE